MKRHESFAWAAVFVLLATFAIPWYLWRNETTVLGIPVWLWYHVGWMLLAAATFAVFGRRAWGVWIEDHGASGRREGGH